MDATKLVKRLQEMREEGYLSAPILREAVKSIKTSDDRFNWVGVYLLDPGEQILWLHNYVGTATEHARIPVGEGVCGTAVQEKQNQLVPDVTEVENYLACNPRVKSELVVLIRAGDEVLGQIDIDSHTVKAFSEKDEQQIQLVADKLAEALMSERR